MLGAATVLFETGYAVLPITPQPQITGRPRDAKLKTVLRARDLPFIAVS
jgi:hypothetical protein